MFAAIAVQSGSRRSLRLSGGAGYSAFGDTRPSYDYVRKGDVLRAVLFLDASSITAPPIDAFRNRLSATSGLGLLKVDSSRLGGIPSLYSGQLVVDVQARSDFAKSDDVLRLIAGVAQASGLSVLISGSSIEFVSKVEDTGGQTPSYVQPAGNGSDKNVVEKFIDNLSQSPISLAVVAGSAVLLLIALKNR